MRISTVSFVAMFAAACGSKTPQSTAPAPTPVAGPVTAPTPTETPTPDPVDTAPAMPAKPVKTTTLAAVGLDPNALDRSADACEDFYQFACGGWMKSTEIAADKPIAMRSFVDISDRNLDYEHGILDAARAKPGNDPLAKQLGAYYGACMDESAIAKAGLKPIAPLLADIAKVKDAKSLTAAIGKLHAAGFGMLFSLGSTQDSADARNVIAGIDQGGLGLPDRDYYLKDDKDSVDLRAKYQAYVEAILTQAGHKPAVAKTEAADVIALETSIAKVSKDKVARRDPKGMYNKIGKDGVAKLMPHFASDVFWKELGLDKVQGVTVTSAEFLSGLDVLISSVKPEQWRTYLTYHLVSKASGVLTKELEDTRFKFESALTGQPVQPPRWKRCVGATDGALGDLLGQVFVRDRFGGDSKKAAEMQVAAIIKAMSENLDALPWMDAETRKKAIAKLDVMSFQIGYPKKWRTYSFKIDAKTWGADALGARKADEARDLAKIDKPVDKDDWQMTAPTVNAYYDPQLNGMVFPAGILQPPFYNVDSSIAVNLGGMGVVVGHELTHGFDDQGAQYDAVGNLTDWWLPDTAKQFKGKTQCVIDQYSSYKVGETALNGANTVGENIADIGGVKLAYTAYHALRASSPTTDVADGFTEDQQFFLGFGQAWCSKSRPDFEKMLATVDVHSPAKWRVDGALSATPAFGRAFNCKRGSKMAPVNACTVW